MIPKRPHASNPGVAPVPIIKFSAPAVHASEYGHLMLLCKRRSLIKAESCRPTDGFSLPKRAKVNLVGHIIRSNGGGGSRTLVPWQVDCHLYVRVQCVIVEPAGAHCQTTANSSQSCVLAGNRSALLPEHSAKRRFSISRGLPTGIGLPVY